MEIQKGECKIHSLAEHFRYIWIIHDETSSYRRTVRNNPPQRLTVLLKLIAYRTLAHANSTAQLCAKATSEHDESGMPQNRGLVPYGTRLTRRTSIQGLTVATAIRLLEA